MYRLYRVYGVSGLEGLGPAESRVWGFRLGIQVPGLGCPGAEKTS